MITKANGYQSSDGAFHKTLEDAQKSELKTLFFTTDRGENTDDDPWLVDEIANEILKSSNKIIDILTMKPNSLPKARKINGGTKKRTKHIAAQNTLPLDTTEPPRAA